MPQEPTHYEVLGVAPDVAPEEIHRAYLRMAREHHPDQRAAAGPRDQRVAGDRMARINEAWRVLGHPGRRRRYDRELRGGPVARGGGGVNGTRDFEFDFRIDAEDDLVEVAPGSMHRLWGLLPWVLVFGVLGAIFVFTAYAVTGTDTEPGSAESTSRVGQCLVLTSARPTISEIDCAAPNDGQVVEEVPPGQPCPTGSRPLDVPGEPDRLCLAG